MSGGGPRPRSLRRHLGRPLAAAAALAALLLAADAPARAATAGADTRELSERDSGIIFTAPGLEGGLRQFYATRDAASGDREVVGLYGPPVGGLPRAEIVLTEAGPGRYISADLPLAHLLDHWTFPSDAAPVGKGSGTARNAIGTVRYLLVTAGAVPCLVFAQVFGPGEGGRQGDKGLFGVYCGAEGTRLGAAEAERILQGLGHRRFGRPAGWRQAEPGGGANELPFAADWEGYGNGLRGRMLVAEGGRVLLLTPDGGACEGEWEEAAAAPATGGKPPHLRWSLLCDNGLAAGGVYVRSAEAAGMAIGKDRYGRSVTIRFGGR